MGIIQRLSPAVINQIAAGEVIERPASVVKELLENAIDAGASRIDLAVERGGKDLIRVTDNGKGIDPDDLPLAFQPHATSKLVEADDLYRIRTLGFRGEALAAIAEVSKTTCRSRTADADSAHEIRIEAGRSSEVEPCSGSPGTVIEVRELFHNTPVRRAYLKSDQTEAGHVAEMFARIALAHPTIHMTYRSSGKVIHDLPPMTGSRERVAVFFGTETADSLLWVESRVERIHLWGYVGHPSQSRSSNKGQFLFVGGRFVRDRSLSHALAEAYRGLLMVGRSPIAFLHLDIPPDEVDVNVHPTKIEVRFRDGHRIYSQLLSTIRQTFLAGDLHARLQGPRDETSAAPAAPSRAPGFQAWSDLPAAANEPEPFGLRPPAEPDRRAVASWFDPPNPASAPAREVASPSMPAAGRVAPFIPFPAPVSSAVPEWARSLPPRTAMRADFDEFAEPASAPASGAPSQPAQLEPTIDREPGEPIAAASIAETDGPIKAIQIHDSYLVVETSDGLVVIDQHALHERILYEEFRMRAERGAVESQRLLVPEPVHLTASEAAAVLERRDGLAKLGIEIEPFGGDTVLVVGTPAMLPNASPEQLLRDLAEQFRGSPVPPARDALLEDVLNMLACKAAVKAGQKLTPEEIDALLARRRLARDAHHCPHGRPTALVFTTAELERQFGRI
ncbi:MAG: DNA mismatch repair endonuclease MutL [Isosphaeraceae bacterium]|nr:DNA mismatch repair endonuclease MutL [Isosphaeraceae bacterium]